MFVGSYVASVVGSREFFSFMYEGKGDDTDHIPFETVSVHDAFSLCF